MVLSGPRSGKRLLLTPRELGRLQPVSLAGFTPGTLLTLLAAVVAGALIELMARAFLPGYAREDDSE
jgi:zinc transporter ZupT